MYLLDTNLRRAKGGGEGGKRKDRRREKRAGKGGKGKKKDDMKGVDPLPQFVFLSTSLLKGMTYSVCGFMIWFNNFIDQFYCTT